MTNAYPRHLTIAFDEAEWLAFSDVVEAEGLPDEELAKRWVLDRLGQLPAVFAAEPVGSGADAADPLERLRGRYRPDDVQVLFVGESADGLTPSFYQAESDLFRAVREACNRAFGAVPDGEAFLGWFREQSCWLWEIPARPMNRKRGRPRKDAVDSVTLRLARLIRELGPDHVIAVTTSIEPAVRRASELAQFRENDVLILPSPVYQWRRRFVDELARYLGEPTLRPSPAPGGGDAAPAMGSLHDAMVRVLIDERGRRLTSREVANAIAARNLYRRADGRHPPASQVGARARRYPSRFDVSSSGIALRGSAS